MSDNDFDDMSFLDGERNKNKARQYVSPSRHQFACSQTAAITMGVCTLLAIVTIAVVAAFIHPVCECLTSERNKNKARQYVSPSRHQFACSQTAAITMGVCTLLAIVTIAVVAAFIHPVCECLTSINPDFNITKVSTNDKRLPHQNIRLPTDVIPQEYLVNLYVDVDLEKFNGTSIFRAKIVQRTDFLVVHAETNLLINALNIKKIDGLNIEERVIKEIFYVKKVTQLVIVMEVHLEVDEEILVTIGYESPLETNMRGLYLSTYKDTAGDTKKLAVTQFEPVMARAAFPCLDEPSFKAVFDIRLNHHKKYTATLSNMPIKSTTVLPDDWEANHFELSVKMSTYLVAFLISEYDHVEKQNANNTTIRVYAPPHYKNNLGLALGAAAKITDYYADFFDTPFPLPKQDLTGIPDFEAGAMENWGLITYRMVALLYDQSINSESQRRYVVTVIAHELAHQWFGNLVTMKWWNDLWLNEGFASFVEYLGTENFDSSYKMMDQFIVDPMQGALSLDGLANSHPISVEVADPAQINAIFDSISYDKGASIIRMLRSVISPEIFQTGLKNYLQKYQYGNAESDDLWKEFSLATGSTTNVKEMMDTWTIQMGYPLVTVKRNATKLHVEQIRFLSSGSKDITEFPLITSYWVVPLTYFTDDDSAVKSEILKVKNGEYNVSGSANWVKANVGYNGVYRVNYDDANWDALTTQLKANHTRLSHFDRTNLISDVFSLAISKDTSYLNALHISEYLKDERHYSPWMVALGKLQYIMDRFLTLPDALTLWKTYLTSLLSGVITDVGYTDIGSLQQKTLRSHLWVLGAKLDHQQITDTAVGHFNAFMNQQTPLIPNLKAAILAIGIRNGQDAEWNFCWALYQKLTDPSDLSTLRHALGHTRDTKLLQKYLGYSLDTSLIRMQDFSSVISSVTNNPLGGQLAWDFFKAHYDLLYQRYGLASFTLGRIVLDVTSFMTTTAQLQEAGDFFSNHDMGSAHTASKQALERIQIHIDWLASHATTITTWLNENLANK